MERERVERGDGVERERVERVTERESRERVESLAESRE